MASRVHVCVPPCLNGGDNMKLTAVLFVILSVTTINAAEPVDLVGKWINSDEKSGGFSKVEISKHGNQWKISAWASDSDGSRDQGEAALQLLGDYVVCPNCVQPTTAKDELI